MGKYACKDSDFQKFTFNQNIYLFPEKGSDKSYDITLLNQ
jgi:hypothetical protein